MKSVKHLVVGPFDVSQAIREIAEALSEMQEKASEEDKKKPAAKKTATKKSA